jgi:hypothetical protein
VNRAVSVIPAVGVCRFASRVIERLLELHRNTEFGGRSGTAEANVPNSSSTETVGVCLVV